MRNAEKKNSPPLGLRGNVGDGRALPSASVQLKAALRGLPYEQQVQLLSTGPDGDAARAAVHAKAQAGLAGTGGALPHLEAIQRSFGPYGVSNIVAHTDANAREATASMGAEAYATGNHVVLGESGGSLHTTAHEAAHVVQQRAGVSLSGGVGAAGDRYERHADAAADAVVQGKSAEPILARMAGSAGSTASSAVQRQQVDGALADEACVPGHEGDDTPVTRAERETRDRIDRHVNKAKVSLEAVYIFGRQTGITQLMQDLNEPNQNTCASPALISRACQRMLGDASETRQETRPSRTSPPTARA